MSGIEQPNDGPPASWQVDVPEITPAMKAACVGEFHFDIEEECSACSFHGADDECEVCEGKIRYMRTVTVPWPVCKDIYQRMLRAKT